MTVALWIKFYHPTHAHALPEQIVDDPKHKGLIALGYKRYEFSETPSYGVFQGELKGGSILPEDMTYESDSLQDAYTSLYALSESDGQVVGILAYDGKKVEHLLWLSL